MNSSPWLAVAVYVREPAAEAPMQTDIAENSDSTLMYSHGASVPSCTRAESPSTMCVCGEIGYAAITSGRHSATASATAREPSICLSMGLLERRPMNQAIRGTGRRDVPVGNRSAEPFAHRGRHGRQSYDRHRGGERPEERAAGDRPPEVLARELGGRNGDQPEAADEIGEAELGDRATAVDQNRPAVAQTAED